MTKKKILTYGSMFAVALFLATGATQADAFFGGSLSADERAKMQQTMFEHKASLLGVSVDEVKNAWANGQNIFELAKAKGISEEELKTRMNTLREEKMKTELKLLVDKGVITEAQANQRLKSWSAIKDKFGAKRAGRGMGMHMMPFGPGSF